MLVENPCKTSEIQQKYYKDIGGDVESYVVMVEEDLRAVMKIAGDVADGVVTLQIQKNSADVPH